MGILPVNNHVEHVHIEYEGGSVTLRFREYNQTIKLFKKEEEYGETRVVVSSSSWYEYETTIRSGDSAYFCMISNGAMLHIPKPRRENDYGDECVVLKISNLEGED
jgi:hypothetical protein